MKYHVVSARAFASEEEFVTSHPMSARGIMQVCQEVRDLEISIRECSEECDSGEQDAAVTEFLYQLGVENGDFPKVDFEVWMIGGSKDALAACLRTEAEAKAVVSSLDMLGQPAYIIPVQYVPDEAL